MEFSYIVHGPNQWDSEAPESQIQYNEENQLYVENRLETANMIVLGGAPVEDSEGEESYSTLMTLTGYEDGRLDIPVGFFCYNHAMNGESDHLLLYIMVKVNMQDELYKKAIKEIEGTAYSRIRYRYKETKDNIVTQDGVTHGKVSDVLESVKRLEFNEEGDLTEYDESGKPYSNNIQDIDWTTTSEYEQIKFSDIKDKLDEYNRSAAGLGKAKVNFRSDNTNLVYEDVIPEVPNLLKRTTKDGYIVRYYKNKANEEIWAVRLDVLAMSEKKGYLLFDHSWTQIADEKGNIINAEEYNKALEEQAAAKEAYDEELNHKIDEIVTNVVGTDTERVPVTFVDVLEDTSTYNPTDKSLTAEEEEAAKKFTDRINIVLTIITTIGMIVAVLMIAILGIKYMLGSVEEKAEYKKDMIPYLVGAVLIFGISSFVTILQQFGVSINKI